MEVLSIRFDELNEVVDYFVLVEAKDTFSGLSKPLFFKQNRHMYQKYLDKIIYVEVEKTPLFEKDAWSRETFQRNQIMKGLLSCEKEDVIIISDVDEIPKSESLLEIFQLFDSKKRQIISCEGNFYRWFLNKKDPRQWVGPACIKYKNLAKRSPQNVREQRTKYLVIPNSTWHFSNMGGYEIFLDKMRAYSHFEESKGLLGLSPDEIYEILSGLDLVEIDQTFPKYIVDNINELDKKNFFDRGYYR